MTNSVDVHGDHKTTTIFGLTGPWVVLLVGVILMAMVAMVFILDIDISGNESASEINIRVEETARRAGDTTRKTSAELGTTNSGDYLLTLEEPSSDKDPSVFSVLAKDIPESSDIAIEVLPITDIGVAELTTPPDSEPIQAMIISLEGVEDSDSQAGVLTFRLSTLQLGDSEPDEISIWRFNKSWDKLSTRHLPSLTDEDGNLYFEAQTPGFSVFMVTKKKTIAPAPTDQPTESATASVTSTPVPTPTPTSVGETDPTATTVPTQMSATATAPPTAMPTQIPTPVTPSPTPIVVLPTPTRLPTPPTPTPTPQPLKIKLIEGTVPVANSGEYFQLKNFRIENIDQLKGDISASIKWGDSNEWTGIPILEESGVVVAGHIYRSGGTFYGDLKIISDAGDLVIHSFKVFVNGTVVVTPQPSPTATLTPGATPIVDPTSTPIGLPTPPVTSTPTVLPTPVPTPPLGATATPEATATPTAAPSQLVGNYLFLTTATDNASECSIVCIRRIDLSDNSVTTPIDGDLGAYTASSFSRGIAIDEQSGLMYFTDATTDAVYKANLDGTNIAFVVDSSQGGSGTSDPNEIELDAAGGWIYWADPGTIGSGRILKSRTDGTAFTVLHTGAEIAEGLALDVSTGFLYFESGGDTRPYTLRRMRIDGTDVQDIVATGVRPRDVVVDSMNQLLYWTGSDRNLPSLKDGIYRTDLSNLQTDLILELEKDPFGLTFDGSNIYFTIDDPLQYGGGLSVRKLNLSTLVAEDVIDIQVPEPQFIEYYSDQPIVVPTSTPTPTPTATPTPVPTATPLPTATPVPGNLLYWVSDFLDKIYLTAGSIWGISSDVVEEEHPLGVEWSGGSLYWTSSLGVRKAHSDGSSPTTLSTKVANMLAVGGGSVYFITDNELWMTSTSGQNQSKLRDLTGGFGVAFDTFRQHLYWTEDTTLYKSNSDGSGVIPYATNITSPKGVAVSESPEYIYWATLGQIWRVDGNGDGKEMVYADGEAVTDVYIDQEDDLIYWTERYFGDLYRANLDGTNRELIQSGMASPVGLTLNK